MRTCYLHLGMPKTGSSSIQAAFATFDAPGLAYAKLKGSNHGPLLCSAFSRNPEKLPETGWRKIRPLRDKLVPPARTRIMQALDTHKDLILSGEIMIDRLDHDEFADMVSTLRSRFGRVVAIAYIRPLASLAASQFQQRVKTGQRRFVLPAPDYRKRFGKVVDLFGAEDIIWRRFDRGDLTDGDIVADFAHVLGLDQPPKSGVTKNESLSAEATAAMYAFNRFTAPLLTPAVQNRIRARLFEELRDRGDTKFGFTPELLERHLRRHADDVTWMETVCRFDVRGRISTVPMAVDSESQLLDLVGRIGDKARSEPKHLAL